jgi:outer membrane protein assembly factor BamB
VGIRIDAKMSGDITESHTVWDKDKRNASEACPVLIGSTYYQITRGGILSAIDAKTGKDLWEDRLQGRFLPSPIALGDKLLICNDPGQCYLVRASPEKFELLATHALPELITSSPVVADGALFIRSAGALYKIAKP